MYAFGYVLKELMEEKSVDVKCLAEHLNLADPSAVYKWLKGEIGFLLPTAVRLADFFDCSLDYLFGRSLDYNGGYRKCPPFDIRLRAVLAEQKTSQYRLIKDKVVSRGNLNSWLNKKQTPQMESVIKLADYLKISIDALIGRER